jgi:DNA-directed RNA polymerase subunit beta'
VLLNRAPTLHRLGIQAFEPILVEGRAIKLHPLVCTAYNADFDGDQMAVHVPLSAEAQAEARLLMLASGNILNPKDGKPVVTPSQDMVLGCYYLTMDNNQSYGSGIRFADVNEAVSAYQRGVTGISLHARVVIPVRELKKKTFTPEQQEALIVTTIGKIIFNEIFPDTFPYINEATKQNLVKGTPDKYFIYEKGADISKFINDPAIPSAVGKEYLGNIIGECFRIYHTTKTSIILDNIKQLGFTYSTRAGITIGVSDVIVPQEKDQILARSEERVLIVQTQYRRGLITNEERRDRVIEIWSKTKDEITDVLMKSMDRYNNIMLMVDSKARGNKSQITQLGGMRGLMANPSGRIIELPIKSNFREGLTVLEYFISTHGARKGLADTALRTADSGYLTRRLVDVAQDVIVREDDCGTDKGISVSRIEDGKEVIEDLFDRIEGRYAFATIRNPENSEIIVNRNELIDTPRAEEIVRIGIKQVQIRSVLSCRARHGVCKLCYGRNLATGKKVEIGEAVGIIAAQSIGEPGTQLTMRTFHTGGVAGDDITQGLPRIQELFEARNPKGQAIISELDGVVKEIRETKDRREIELQGGAESKIYPVSYGSRIRVVQGQQVEAGDELTDGSIDPKEMLRIKGIRGVQNYILQEVQRVYRNQGVEINDKHIEVMIKQMLRKIRIVDPGDTILLPGAFVDLHEYEAANREAILADKEPAVARPVLLGITKASLETDSFLSAASFQETTRVLTDAAIKGKVDRLLGLKENVIIGKLIPAGTGMARYRNIRVVSPFDEPTDETAELEPVGVE